MNCRALSIIALAAGLAAAGSARAQDVNRCIDQCFGAFSPSQNGGSTTPRDLCLQQCKPSARSGPKYGAIAFSPSSGAWGYAYGKPNAHDADTSAMARCRENGAGCQLVASYSNACAAVVWVKSKGLYSTGQSSTTAEAKATAMRICRAKYGNQCEAWVHTCATDRQ